MPSINNNIGNIGRGFAAFLAPPPEGVVRFTVGQPDFRTPKSVVEAAKNDLDNGLHGYTRSQGSEEVCQSVATHLQKYGLEADPIDVVISPGCKQALLYAMMTCLNPGDEVILFSPAWPSYDGMLKLIGAVPVHVPVHRENYHPDLDATRKAITDKTKAIVINSPNNPTGAVATKEQLKTFVDYANEHKAVILFDSAYAAFITDPDLPRSIYEIEGAETCAIEMNSFSKTAGFTGVRLAWTIVPKALMTEDTEAGKVHALWTRRQNTFFNGASNIVQAGGLAALSEEGRVQTDAQVAFYLENARIINEGLKSLGITTYGGGNAPYVWLKTPGGLTSWDFFDKLLKECYVVGTPGSGFGPAGEGFFRLSAFGHRENVEKAVNSLKERLKI